MTPIGFALFDTPLGPAAIAWTERGVLRTWTYCRDSGRTRSRVRAAIPGAVETPPPPAIQRAIDGIVTLFGGQPAQLGEVPLDTAAIDPFDLAVYRHTRAIPFGATTTYGAIAKALGEEPIRARDVGAALGRNPFAPIVPCHRVVAAGGRLGGFSAPGGAATKRRLLELEAGSLGLV